MKFNFYLNFVCALLLQCIDEVRNKIYNILKEGSGKHGKYKFNNEN